MKELTVTYKNEALTLEQVRQEIKDNDSEYRHLAENLCSYIVDFLGDLQKLINIDKNLYALYDCENILEYEKERQNERE